MYSDNSEMANKQHRVFAVQLKMQTVCLLLLLKMFWVFVKWICIFVHSKSLCSSVERVCLTIHHLLLSISGSRASAMASCGGCGPGYATPRWEWCSWFRNGGLGDCGPSYATPRYSESWWGCLGIIGLGINNPGLVVRVLEVVARVIRVEVLRMV